MSSRETIIKYWNARDLKDADFYVEGNSSIGRYFQNLSRNSSGKRKIRNSEGEPILILSDEYKKNFCKPYYIKGYLAVPRYIGKHDDRDFNISLASHSLGIIENGSLKVNNRVHSWEYYPKKEFLAVGMLNIREVIGFIEGCEDYSKTMGDIESTIMKQIGEWYGDILSKTQITQIEPYKIISFPY